MDEEAVWDRVPEAYKPEGKPIAEWSKTAKMMLAECLWFRQ